MPKKIVPEKTGSEESSDGEYSSETESEQSLPNSPVKIVPSSQKKTDTSSGEEDESESESESEGAETDVVPLAANRADTPQKSGAAGGKRIRKAMEHATLPKPAESESESEGAETDVVPLAANRADTPQKSGAAAGGKRIPKAMEHATLPKPAGGKSKRTTEGLDTKGGKKAKKTDDGLGLGKSHGEPEATSSKKKLELSSKGEKSSINDDTKKQLFQRVWSEDDEITVLKGMVDYAEEKKRDPALDLDSFHKFIKDNLHFDVSRNQIQDKIRRLRKKYLNNKTKELEGSVRYTSNAHEQQVYELSKEVWGKKNFESVVGNPKSKPSAARKRQIKSKVENGEETKMENGKSEEINMVDVVNGDADTVVRKLNFASGDTDSIVPSSFQNMDMESLIKSIGTKLYEGDGMVQGTKEWRQLALEEIELYDKKLCLNSARAKLVISGLKSRNL